MLISVFAEGRAGERRVAISPDGVKKLVADGHTLAVEAKAGEAAGFGDQMFIDAGATILKADEVTEQSGVLVGINAPAGPFGEGQTVVSLLDPLWNAEAMPALASGGASLVSLELIPRITRAQSMDVLSSMATVAGTEAVLLAARRLPKMFPLMMTAAGTIPAARVLILGAGVAGLQSIATARRLGAIVEGYDVRPAAVEQIESLGAKAVRLELDTENSEDSGGYAKEQSENVAAQQQALLAKHVGAADVVITTAAIPGRASPLLVPTSMVETMASGSVIVDLAAERGGNCELTEKDGEVDFGGVTVLGPTDLAAGSAQSASQMFSNNVVTLLRHLNSEGDLNFDFEDEITAGIVVAHEGEVVHPMVSEALVAKKEGQA